MAPVRLVTCIPNPMNMAVGLVELTKVNADQMSVNQDKRYSKTAHALKHPVTQPLVSL